MSPDVTLEMCKFQKPQLQRGRKINWRKIEESSAPYACHIGHTDLLHLAG